MANSMSQMQQAILQAVLRLTPRPQSLLDIGCGNASFTRVMASDLPQTSVVGLDPVLPRRPAPRGIRFVVGDVTKLPFDEASFDVLTSCKSFHHWGDKKAGLQESYRVLKKGGWLVIGDGLIQGWLDNRVMRWMVKHLDSGDIADYNELVSMLKSVGFESTSITMIPKSLNSLFLILAQKP